MADYSISLDLPNVKDLDKIFDTTVFPLMAQAIKASALEARKNWIQAVASAKLPLAEQQRYIASIGIRYLDPLNAEVYATYDRAQEIESGRPAQDLKQMLNTSMKVRRSQKGTRFLIIPFRHNTPGHNALAPDMPSSVYALASQMEASRVTGMRERNVGEDTILSPTTGMAPAPIQSPYLSSIGTKSAMTTAAAKYKWGARLTKQDLKDEPAATQKRYAGMVRMMDANRGSAYLTFRTMSENSTGWVIPATPGLYLVKGVTEHLQPVIQAALEEAVRRSAADAGLSD